MKEIAEKFGDKINRHKDLLTILGTIIVCFIWIHGEIQQQSQRTDRLYEMFIDLLKEKK